MTRGSLLHNNGYIFVISHIAHTVFISVVIIAVTIIPVVIHWPCLCWVGYPLPVPSQVRSSRPQENRNCPWGALLLRDGPLLATKPLLGYPEVMPQCLLKTRIFSLWAFAIWALSQNSCFIWAWTPGIIVPAALPHTLPLPSLWPPGLDSPVLSSAWVQY
jgi:hypothetical protein